MATLRPLKKVKLAVEYNAYNVDNTSDENKPISILTQAALDLKQSIVNMANYLTTTVAASTYLTIANAVATYAPLTSPTLNANVRLASSGWSFGNPSSFWKDTAYTGTMQGGLIEQYQIEMINNGLYQQTPTKGAFGWYIQNFTTSSTYIQLMKLLNNGNLSVTGTITSPTITAITTANTANANAITNLQTQFNSFPGSRPIPQEYVTTGKTYGNRAAVPMVIYCEPSTAITIILPTDMLEGDTLKIFMLNNILVQVRSLMKFAFTTNATFNAYSSTGNPTLNMINSAGLCQMCTFQYNIAKTDLMVIPSLVRDINNIYFST